jgi:acetolactate synthase I/II/III large subunit
MNIELARVREGEANEKMLSLMYLDNPSLDWVKVAEGQGVPATRATTAEEFHKHRSGDEHQGSHLIEATIVQNLQPAIDAVHKTRVP